MTDSQKIIRLREILFHNMGLDDDQVMLHGHSLPEGDKPEKIALVGPKPLIAEILVLVQPDDRWRPRRFGPKLVWRELNSATDAMQKTPE